ncbi:MAG TPA: rhodanese-like domain-containing protein [Pyrinomonadaceae bacterium]
MKRRLFLALVLGALAASGARAQGAAAQQPQEVPPDRVTLEEFKTLYAAGKVLVLDVRYGPDRKIRGAALVPLDQLESRLAGLPRDREIVTYCS